MELFRLFKSRKFIAAVIFLLLLNCAVFYITQKRSIENDGVSINVYSYIFEENSSVLSAPNAKEIIDEKNSRFEVLGNFVRLEKMKAENSGDFEYEYFTEEEALLISENPELYQEYKSGRYSEEELAAASNFYMHFSYQLEYQNNYQDYITSIIEKGDELSGRKLFSDENSFSYKSIKKSVNDFSDNKNLELSLVNDYPILSVLNYQIGDFIIILIGIFLVITFLAEKNFSLLINSCKNGRVGLKLKQIPILFMTSVVCSVLIYISELFIACKIYNVPLNINATIQSSDLFSDCTLHFTFLQFIILYVLFKALVSLIVPLILWFLVLLYNNVTVVSGITGVIIAVEFLFYKNISRQSTVSFLKTFNLFSFFDYKNLSEYNLISFFSAPIRTDIVIYVLTILILIFVSFAILLAANHTYPINTPNKIFNFIAVLFEKLSGVYAKLKSIIYAGRFETFKLMHIGKGLLIFVIFIAIIGFNFNTNNLVFSSTEIFLNDYYEEYGGELDSEVYKSIDKMQQEAQAVADEFALKQELYLNGKITIDEYEMAYAKNEAYDTQRKAIEILNTQIERLEKLTENGITPMLFNETGYNSLFDEGNNQSEILLLICVIIMMFSSVFSVEKTSHMIVLNHCSKFGRNKLFAKKIVSSMLMTFIICAVSYAMLILQIDYLYDLKCFGADIHNLQCLQTVGIKVSIFEYLILNFLFEFIFAAIICLIVLSLSLFVSQLAAVIISACIFALPSLFYLIGIYAAKKMSAIYQFNLNTLFIKNEITVNLFAIHYVLIVGCIILFYLCLRNWSKTKER